MNTICIYGNISVKYTQRLFFLFIFSKYHTLNEKVKNIFNIDTEIKVERVEKYMLRICIGSFWRNFG